MIARLGRPELKADVEDERTGAGAEGPGLWIRRGAVVVVGGCGIGVEGDGGTLNLALEGDRESTSPIGKHDSNSPLSVPF
jgi:hypothetical protein